MVERIRILLESRQLTPTQFADIIGVARPIVSHILSGRNKPSLEVVQRILAAMPDLAMPWLLNGAGPMLADTSVAAKPLVPSGAVAVADEPSQAVPQAAVDISPFSIRGSQHDEQESVSNAVPIAPPQRTSTPTPVRSRVAPKRFVVNAGPLDAFIPAPDSTQALPQPLAVPTDQPAVALVQDSAPSPSIPVPTPLIELPVAAVPVPPVPADEPPGAAFASALFAGGDKPIRRIVIFYRDGSFADYQPE